MLASVVVLVSAGALASCSDDDGSGSTASTTFKPNLETRDPTWQNWNNEAAARGFTTEANAAGTQVAKDIAAGGVKCEKPLATIFGQIATTYYRQGLPIPVGSVECEGPAAEGVDAENILIEVMGTTAPTGDDLVSFKRDLLCKQAKDTGRLPDGTSDFPGIPYVMTADKTIVVQPDTHATNREIAKALGLTAHDMCEGIT
jgi:hypothetical protein